MKKNTSDKKIHQDMTVLDIISKYRQTEVVFKGYDKSAGECVCCNALFEPLKNIAVKYDLNLEQLMADLEKVVNGNSLTKTFQTS